MLPLNQRHLLACKYEILCLHHKTYSIIRKAYHPLSKEVRKEESTFSTERLSIDDRYAGILTKVREIMVTLLILKAQN